MTWCSKELPAKITHSAARIPSFTSCISGTLTWLRRAPTPTLVSANNTFILSRSLPDDKKKWGALPDLKQTTFYSRELNNDFCRPITPGTIRTIRTTLKDPSDQIEKMKPSQKVITRSSTKTNGSVCSSALTIKQLGLRTVVSMTISPSSFTWMGNECCLLPCLILPSIITEYRYDFGCMHTGQLVNGLKSTFWWITWQTTFKYDTALAVGMQVKLLFLIEQPRLPSISPSGPLITHSSSIRFCRKLRS